MRRLVSLGALLLLCGAAQAEQPPQGARERHLLYVVVPGIRNYLEFGGAGILVYDIDAGHKLVRRGIRMSYERSLRSIGMRNNMTSLLRLCRKQCLARTLVRFRN